MRSERVIPWVSAPLLVANLAAALSAEQHLGRDSTIFRMAGAAIVAGQNPYPIVQFPNLNPPLSLLLFRPMSVLSDDLFFWAIDAAFLLSLVAAAVLLWQSNPPSRPVLMVTWLLSLAGVWQTLAGGQIYGPLILATALAWVALGSRRPLLAGPLIGFVVAVKPNLILLPLLLAVSGEWLVALLAGATVIALSVLPVVAFGPGVYREWLAVLPGPAILNGTNASLFGVGDRLGVLGLGWPLAIVLVLGVAVLVYRQRPDARSTTALGLVVSLLAAPLAWPGYTLLLLPIFFERAWSMPLRIAAALLSVPWFIVAVLSLGPLGAASVGQTYTAALLLILGSLAVDIARRGRSPRLPARQSLLVDELLPAVQRVTREVDGVDDPLDPPGPVLIPPDLRVLEFAVRHRQKAHRLH